MWSKNILLHYLYYLVVLKFAVLGNRETVIRIEMSEQKHAGGSLNLRNIGLLLRCCTTVGQSVRSMKAAALRVLVGI